MTQSRLVLKFGGTSVADLEYIKHAASIVLQEANKGHEVIVVVSAMAGETNKLLDHCQSIGDTQDAREVDVVISAGEQITSALMAMALQNIGAKARSFLGWQIPLQTSNLHMNAGVESIETATIETYLKSGGIAIVPGFQGVSEHSRITTLGRGGSDLSAVALAAAFKAIRCDIYTDVAGVYFCDPRILSDRAPEKLDEITYDEIIEMSKYGAKVMQHESVSYAKKHDVTVQVLSTFGKHIGSDLQGTLIVNQKQKNIRAQPTAFVMNEKIIGFECEVSAQQHTTLTAFLDLYKTDIKLVLHKKNKCLIYTHMPFKATFEHFFKETKMPTKTINALIECVFISKDMFKNKQGLAHIKQSLAAANLHHDTILYSESKISVIMPSKNRTQIIQAVCENLMK